VPSIALSLLKGEIARVTPGKQIRDYLHVEDLASAIWAVTTRGQTDNFTVLDFVRVLEEYLPKDRRIDVVVYQKDGRHVDTNVLRRYASKDQAQPVQEGDLRRLGGRKAIANGFLAKGGDLLRHDPEQLAKALQPILRARRTRR
jgi:nucleoside-diphosphate-sugar epimerase